MFGVEFWLPGWFQISLTLFATMLYLVYYYFTCTFNYWKDKGVKYVKPYPIVGSIGPILSTREHALDFNMRLYRQYEGEPYIGLYQGRNPSLMLLDPEIIKHVLVKDFHHFTDHGIHAHEEADPLEAKNLFNLEGQKWKEMRAKLTPTFTSGRMKAMFPLVLECAQQFEQHLAGLASTGGEFEAKDLMSRFTTDAIGSCAFGIQCNSIKEPNCEFRVMGKRLIEADLWRGIKTFFIVFVPEVAHRLKFALIDKETTDFFRTLVRDVISIRTKTEENRNDFMQLLIEIKEKGQLSKCGDDGDTENITSNSSFSESFTKLSDDDIAAQAAIFFLGGFETSSTVMSFAMLELALNPELQRQVQDEIDDVLMHHDGELTYHTLQDMKYLDSVLQESLRKYPPLHTTLRKCTKNYTFPNSNLTIDEGTMITIPIHTLQNDPKYFPNPERFDPERFRNLGIEKKKYIYIPFGEGPRMCIGNRFAIMQSKMGLVAVFHKFNVDVCSRTKFPVIFDPRTSFLNSIEGIWLRVTPRK